MLQEISSVGAIRYAPVANAERTKLLYARNVEDGIGIFLVDLRTQQRQRLEFVKSPEPDSTELVRLVGWSPDDRCLAYSSTHKSDSLNQHLVLCEGSNGRSITSFDFPAPIRQAIWLSTASLAFLDESHHFYVINLEPQKVFGQFGKQGLVRLRQLGSDDSSYLLAAMSSNLIAYVSNGNIWSLDILTQQAQQLSQLTNATLQWLDYSPATSAFLFCLRTPEINQELYRLTFGVGTNNRLYKVSGALTFKGQWLEAGSGVTYIGTASNINFLAVSSMIDRQSTNLFVDGHIRSYNLDPCRRSIYAVASTGDEPMGIWEYNIAARTLRNVVVGMEQPFAFSALIPPVKDVLVSDGRTINYFLLPPARLDKNKRYPVLIDGPQDSRWHPASQILANAGIFFVAVNPSGLYSSDDLSNGTQDTLAVYNELLRNPNVDPHRIFIAGSSASTALVAELVDHDPSLWRGAALLSPVRFPEIPPHNSTFPSIFISVGTDEREDRMAAVDRFSQAARSRHIPVEVVYHRNAAHIFANPQLMKERYAALVKFILINR